ncbi:hypothetical protein JL979_02860 [Staphylococcus pseudintermedius]|nr:hypothetical protein [Staphylococcus pseudintermedius]MCE5523487.1 hypothetical protein [Staphylococcus pseudintermedius]MCE5782398.1 hypothetical protein [Staphylococcus pseudintermedius]
MQKNIDYLSNLVQHVTLKDSFFEVFTNDGKKILGMMGPFESNFNKMLSIETIYQNISDLDFKIKLSYYKILSYDLEKIYSNFSPFNIPSKDEIEVIYYMENILFRTSIIWDLLAQICNIYWDKNIPINKVSYYNFFKNNSKGEKAKSFAIKVNDYLNQSYNNSSDDEKWTGNHKYLKEMRNALAHKSSQNINSLTNFSQNIRLPFIHTLKIIIEDYHQVHLFLNEIFEEIERTFIV